MAPQTPREKLIERVVKLFKLGEHKATGGQAGTTEAEMMLAVTKARQLMAQHSIDMAELELAKGHSLADQMRDRMRQHSAYTRKGTALAIYDHQVARAVAALTDTRMFLQHGWADGQTISMMFLGHEDDVAVASELFMIWLQEVRKMTRRVYGGGNTWAKQHTSYATGLGMRLIKRAEEMVTVAPDQQQTWGLVLASKQLAVQTEWDKLLNGIEVFKALTKQKDKKPRARKWDEDALGRGWRDGADFDMNKRILK